MCDWMRNMQAFFTPEYGERQCALLYISFNDGRNDLSHEKSCGFFLSDDGIGVSLM